MPLAPLPVVINRSGGTAAALGDRLEDTVHEAFAAAGLGIALELVEGAAISAVVERLSGQPMVVVGGGDGTLGQAAGRLAPAGSTLAILPLGTRNHLAAQLGIPGDLAEAARVIAAGRRRRIDLARAGDRVFVNNASLGLYGKLVRSREAIGAPKWLANIPATFHVLRRLRAHPLRLEIDGRSEWLETPLLFIGNNRYVLERGRLGTRDALDRGELAFYAVGARTPLQLVGMALRLLVGRADPERDFAALTTGQSARISGRDSVDVACDGEVRRMTLPLELASLPGALEVVIP